VINEIGKAQLYGNFDMVRGGVVMVAFRVITLRTWFESGPAIHRFTIKVMPFGV